MKKIVCSLILASSLSVNAELVSVGQGEGVYDTSTGLTWSSFEKTRGYSISELNKELGYGGSLYGWELAGHNIIFDLWSNNVPRYEDNSDEGIFAVTETERAEWNALFGVTHSDNRSSSYYFNPDVNAWNMGGYYRDGMLNFYGENASPNHTAYVEKGTYKDFYGYYLILGDQFKLSDSGNITSSDLPISTWLFGLPLLAMLRLKHKRKRV